MNRESSSKSKSKGTSKGTSMGTSKRKRQKGSVSLEAVVVFPVVILIMITLISMALSLYIDLDVQNQSAVVANQMQIMMQEDYNDMTFVNRGIRSIVLEQWGNYALKDKLTLPNGIKSLSSMSSFIGNDGVFVWRIHYTYNLPFYHKDASLVIPITGLLAGDDVSGEEPIFYVTRTGERYHKGDCWYLRKSKVPMPLSEAIKAGYTPCKVCKPDAE